jgi:aminocarboxymuconate-semialdehyde decarboxylase
MHLAAKVRLAAVPVSNATSGLRALAASSQAPKLGKKRTPTVDMHTHFLPQSWPCFESRHGGGGWPSMRLEGALPGGVFGYGRGCDAMLMSGSQDFRPVTRACWDVDARLQDMDAAGIDMQLISATPILFQWSRPPLVALDVAKHFNDWAVEMCSTSKGRLQTLCQVPLQDVDLSCREVERAMASGHVGVHIGNHVGLEDLDDGGLVTFLQHCADIGAPVLVHPWDMPTLDGRLDKYMMGWTVGMPMETHLSICAMVLGGAFDRLSRSLKICFAHGGGAFPFLLGRLENAWHERSIARGKSQCPPSTYLDRFSVDSAVFDHRALQLLVDTMGSERVMLGSDYPFPLGEQKVGDLIRTSPTLDKKATEAILGANAASFFSLEHPANLLADDRKERPTASASLPPVTPGEIGQRSVQLSV